MRLYPAEKNVGGWDRLLRLIVGPVLLVVAGAAVLGAVALSPALTAVIAVVGAILTVTGIIQKCTLNHLLGLNTYTGRAPADAEAEPEIAERPT